MTLKEIDPYIADAGIAVPAEDEKFNPFHSPTTGEFSSGGGGGAGGVSAGGYKKATRKSISHALDKEGMQPLGKVRDVVNYRGQSVPMAFGKQGYTIRSSPATRVDPPSFHISQIGKNAQIHGILKNAGFHMAGEASDYPAHVFES